MLMTTTHSSRPASPAISVRMTQSASRKIPCKPSPVKLACGRPWAESPPLSPAWPRPSTYHAAATTFQESIEFAFLPGDNRNVIDLSIAIPAGKRLLFQTVRLMSGLPTGQHASVVVGSLLTLDANGEASIHLYGDRTTSLKAFVTRDSKLGSGEMILEVEGSYVDLPAIPNTK